MLADYMERLRPAFPDKSEAEIELLLSVSFQLRKSTGLSAHEHRKRGMQKLFPSRAWHDWREQRVASVQECLEGGIQELAWMGSASSGKSADMSDIALTLWWSNPRVMTVYITSPYLDATEKNIWSSITEQFYEAKDANPTLPGTLRTSQNAIVLDERAHPRSIIQTVSVDEVGKMKGKKAIDANAGNIIVIVDELPEFKGTAAQNFIKTLANLKANQNLLVLTAGNFTSIGDGFARITDPDEKDIPSGWYGFNADLHMRWRTKRGGLALRFDGLQSPNVREGRDVYPYLTRIGFVASHASAPGGLQSPDAMREVRSAPITAMEEYTVTNPERIRAGKAKDAFQWTGEAIQTGAFCDFGLGGDPCVVLKFQLGWMTTPTGKKQMINFPETPFVIPIQIGTPVPVQDQAALGLKAWAEANQVLPENVGYDAAMRPGFAQRVMELYSMKARAIDSNGPATDRPINATDKHPDGKPITWRDKVDRLVSEFWFVVASLIDSGQVRGLQLQDKGVEQLCTRRWEPAGKKKRLQTKLQYKELLRAMGRNIESPNEADALAGCVEMARRMGLSVEAVAPQGGSAKLLLDLLKEREMQTTFAVAKSGTSLPPGRIHAMQFTSPLAPGKLNRRF